MRKVKSYCASFKCEQMMQCTMRLPCSRSMFIQCNSMYILLVFLCILCTKQKKVDKIDFACWSIAEKNRQRFWKGPFVESVWIANKISIINNTHSTIDLQLKSGEKSHFVTIKMKWKIIKCVGRACSRKSRPYCNFHTETSIQTIDSSCVFYFHSFSI